MNINIRKNCTFNLRQTTHKQDTQTRQSKVGELQTDRQTVTHTDATEVTTTLR